MPAAILEYIWSVSALGAIAALIIVPSAQPKVIHPNHKAPYGENGDKSGTPQPVIYAPLGHK